jgi:hypothetical protein
MPYKNRADKLEANRRCIEKRILEGAPWALRVQAKRDRANERRREIANRKAERAASLSGTRSCPCGDEFAFNPTNTGKRYCSRKCKESTPSRKAYTARKRARPEARSRRRAASFVYRSDPTVAQSEREKGRAYRKAHPEKRWLQTAEKRREYDRKLAASRAAAGAMMAMNRGFNGEVR